MSIPEYLTPDELCQRLKVTPRWIDRQVAEGKLRFTKIGHHRRFTEKNFWDFVALYNAGNVGPDDQEFFDDEG